MVATLNIGESPTLSLAAFKVKVQAARASALVRNPFIVGPDTSAATVSISSTAPSTAGMTQYPALTGSGEAPYSAALLIEGGVPFNPYNSAITAWSALKDPTLGVTAANAAVSGYRLSIKTTSAQVVFYVASDGSYPYRVLVDGVYVDSTGIAPTGAVPQYITVTPAVRKLHTITLELQSPHFLYKLWVNTGDACYKPVPKPYRILVHGDSYPYGVSGFPSVATTFQNNSIYATMGQLLGAEVVRSGVGGTGFTVSNGAPNNKFIDRIADIDRLAWDVLMVPASVNDAFGTSTVQQISDAVAAYLTLARAKYPNAPILMPGLCQTSTATTKSAQVEAALASMVAARGDKRMAFIPVQSAAIPYIQTWTAGNALVNADGVHLTALGMQVHGERVAADAYDALMAMAA